jgi:hypothetical protein
MIDEDEEISAVTLFLGNGCIADKRIGALVIRLLASIRCRPGSQLLQAAEAMDG